MNQNDGKPEHDPEPEQPVTGRQKATAPVSLLHPPEMLAKLSTGFKRQISKLWRVFRPIMQCLLEHITTQPDGILFDDLRVGMKRAAGKISRLHFEIYATPRVQVAIVPGPPGQAGVQGPSATAGASWARSSWVVLFFARNPRSGSPLRVVENKSSVTVRVAAPSQWAVNIIQIGKLELQI